MGCFLACFGLSEVEKRRKRSRRIQPRDRRYHVSKPVQQGSFASVNATENPQVLGKWEKPDEQLSLRKRKKVTFDSNVKVYEPDLPHEEADLLLVDNHVPPSYGTYPPNHRYQSCNYSNNEEDEVLDYGDSHTDDEDEDEGEELKRGASKMESCAEEIESNGIWTRDRSVLVHPVLNPVENLGQWKAAKARGALNLRTQKQNSSGFNGVSLDLNPKTDHFAVDASLSNWLISSKTRR